MKHQIRQTWDEYFLNIAKQVASRSTCRRRQVGAIAVRDKHILSTGYNGAPAGIKDCLELGCLRDELGIPSGTRHEICRAVHAEQNVIIQAHTDLKGSRIYCTHSPCILCAKMLVNAKIDYFICSEKYSDRAFIKLFEEAGIIHREGS